jgi:hypothetical protein
MTLLITGVFAVSAGASPNAVALCSLVAVLSIGVGGNLPVDSAVFLGMSAIATGASGFSSHEWELVRIYSCVTPIPVDGLVYLVGSGATAW